MPSKTEELLRQLDAIDEEAQHKKDALKTDIRKAIEAEIKAMETVQDTLSKLKDVLVKEDKEKLAEYSGRFVKAIGYIRPRKPNKPKPEEAETVTTAGPAESAPVVATTKKKAA